MSVNPESMSQCYLLRRKELFLWEQRKKQEGWDSVRLAVATSLCCMLCNSATGQAAARASTSQERPSYWGLWGELNLRCHFNATVLNMFKLSCSFLLFVSVFAISWMCHTCTTCTLYTQEEDDFKDPWLEPDKPKGKGKGRGKDKAAESASASAPQSFDVKGDWVCWVVKSLLGLARSKSEPVDTVAAAAQVAAKMQAGNLPEGKRCDMCFQLFTYITTAIEMSILCHPPFSLFS